MTQLSFAWSCTAVGDGGPQSYSVEVVEAINRLMGNVSPADSGVIYWTDPAVFPGFTNPIGGTPDANFFLTPSNPVGATVRIKPGAGSVQGWLFINDADVDFNFVGGNANATDIIGLRRDLAGQTVRLFRGLGGVGATYSLVQTAATWEIPLVEVQLSAGGAYQSHTDVREFVQTPLVPVQAAHVYEPVSHGYNITGLAVLQPVGSGVNPFTSIIGAYGVQLAATVESYAWAVFSVPDDIVGDEINVEFELDALTASGNNNMELRLGYRTLPVAGGGALAAAAWQTIASTYTTTQKQWINWNTVYGTLPTAAFGAVVPRDTIVFYIERDGPSANDTNTQTVIITGARLLYNKRQATYWDTTLNMQ